MCNCKDNARAAIAFRDKVRASLKLEPATGDRPTLTTGAYRDAVEWVESALRQFAACETCDESLGESDDTEPYCEDFLWK